MPVFEVTFVIDGGTFEVNPDWKWQGQIGNRVRPTGYKAPGLDQRVGERARTKLSRLIGRRTVEINFGHRMEGDRLVADVYHKDRPLSDFFPEYKQEESE